MPLFSYLCVTQENLFLRCSYRVLLVQGKEFQMHIILKTKTNNATATAGKVCGWLATNLYLSCESLVHGKHGIIWSYSPTKEVKA